MANKKFSDFTSKTSPSDVSFVVGYDGSDNVRISIANMNSAYLPLVGGTMTGNINLGDTNYIYWGNSNDFYIGHTGTNTVMLNSTGHLEIANYSDDKSIYLQTDDGSGGITTYIKVDGLANYTEFPVAARFMDSVQLQFGDSSDGHIAHDGADMTIQNSFDDGDLKFKSDDGSGGVADYFWLDGGIVKTRFAKEATFGDNVKLTFGNVVTPDLEIYHDGSHSFIKDAGTGSLITLATDYQLNNSANSQNMITATDGGAVTLFTAGVAKLATTSTGVSVTGNANFADDGKAIFGAPGNDLQIYHDASNSYINDAGTGLLKLLTNGLEIKNAADDSYMAFFGSTGASELYHNGSKKFETTSTGVNVTGKINISALNTAVTNASDTGTVGDIRFTADYIFVCVATDTWKRVAIATW